MYTCTYRYTVGLNPSRAIRTMPSLQPPKAIATWLTHAAVAMVTFILYHVCSNSHITVVTHKIRGSEVPLPSYT